MFAATSDTMRVLVAARDVAPGEVIGADRLRVVELGRSGDVRAIQPMQQDLILGQAARGPIPAGTVLNTDLFADRDAGDPRRARWWSARPWRRGRPRPPGWRRAIG